MSNQTSVNLPQLTDLHKNIGKNLTELQTPSNYAQALEMLSGKYLGHAQEVASYAGATIDSWGIYIKELHRNTGDALKASKESSQYLLTRVEEIRKHYKNNSVLGRDQELAGKSDLNLFSLSAGMLPEAISTPIVMAMNLSAIELSRRTLNFSGSRNLSFAEYLEQEDNDPTLRALRTGRNVLLLAIMSSVGGGGLKLTAGISGLGVLGERLIKIGKDEEIGGIKKVYDLKSFVSDFISGRIPDEVLNSMVSSKAFCMFSAFAMGRRLAGAYDGFLDSPNDLIQASSRTEEVGYDKYNEVFTWVRAAGQGCLAAAALIDMFDLGTNQTKLKLNNLKDLGKKAEEFFADNANADLPEPILKQAKIAKDITSTVTQAQRAENAQRVSPNLRQSESLEFYGYTFKGIQSKDGQFFYLDDPLDVQKIYALAVIERAKEKNLSKEILDKALDRVTEVAAFYDKRNDIIISPRASLFEDHTMRQIVSGVIRHEKAHKEGKDELGALQEQRELYTKRGISFYLEAGELIVDKKVAVVRSSSDQELAEYVANNSTVDQLEIFTIRSGRKKLSKEQTSRIFEIMQNDVPNEAIGKHLNAIDQILKRNNSNFDIRKLMDEILEIVAGKETKQTKDSLIKVWGFSEKDLPSLISWLKKSLKDVDSIEIVERSLGIKLAPQKLHRMLLITKFERLETDLGNLLAENKTSDISQKTLDLLADLYKVPTTDGRMALCPASFKVNIELGGFTDLPSDGDFANKVKWVHIHNALDANCLRELNNHLGFDVAEIARVALLDVIWRNVKARLAATNIKLQHVKLGEKKVPVWNKLVTPRSKWSAANLDELLETLDAAKLFELPDTDPRFGVPRTSVTINPEMNDRLWSSDACMSFLSQKVEAPHLVGRNLITNAGFILHPSNVRAATLAICCPVWYRDDPNPSHGISHIFQRNGLQWDDANKVPPIESIMPDPAWGNNKRLESQALLLQHLVDTIIAGACLGETKGELAELGKDWGFNWLGGEFPEKNEPLTAKQKEYIISSIQILASYLLSVEWDGSKYDMLAPTVSSWEEAAQPGGCASDTGFMVEAMSSLKDLLFNPAFDGNAVITEVRDSLKTKLPQFADNRDGATLLQDHPYADFRVVENLENFIRAGNTFLSQMVIHPILATIDGTSVSTPTGVKQFPNRGPDTSLAVLAAFYKQFDSSPARNARIRYGLVRAAKDQLTNAHPEYLLGMRRYAPFWSPDCNQWLIDSYLNYQFEFGLIVPGLVKPTFAQRIAKEYATIAPHMEDRLRNKNASPRDLIIMEAYQRFCTPGTLHHIPDAKKDANTPWAMAGRQQFSLPEWVAQWTIGPTAAVIALAQAKQEILQYLETTNNFNEKPVMHLLDMVNDDLTFFINLCISSQVQKTDAEGNVILRADGTELPNEINTMEAFQAVPDVEGNDVFLPGGHTLTWSNVQLNKGLRMARLAAHKYELLKEKMLGLVR